MINLKILAREIGAPVEELARACRTLNLPIQGEECPQETAEILQEIGKQSTEKGIEYLEAVLLLSKEKPRDIDSPEPETWRDEYNRARYGTTEAAPGSVMGVMLSDQQTIGETLGKQRLAAVIDYSSAALLQGLTHGEEALSLGKSEATEAIAQGSQKVQDLMANLVQWKPKQLTGATPSAKQLKPSSN